MKTFVTLLTLTLFAHGYSGDLVTQEIFSLQRQHCHGPTLVECPNGNLIAGWFQGSGERWADDVAILGSRLRDDAQQWSAPFVLADVPDFPDINPMMFIDSHERLWLVWYTVLANQWETSLPKYRISSNYMQSDSAPEWDWQDVIHFKPGGKTERGIQPDDPFVATVDRKLAELNASFQANGYGIGGDQSKALATRWKAYQQRIRSLAAGENMKKSGRVYKSDGTYESADLGYPYFRRMGWQTKNKPFILDHQRLIIPFYSDGFGFSIMAITDDWGTHWHFGEPIVGIGNIQASIVQKSDGTLVAYMRDNGPAPKRIVMSESADRGKSWSQVKDTALPNPGAGTDAVTLQNGHWILVYNDTEKGRHSLAVALSTNNGESWDHIRHLEHDLRGEQATTSHYPAVIQGKDGTIHVVYSFHHHDRDGGPHKTIKYARFDEEWIMQK